MTETIWVEDNDDSIDVSEGRSDDSDDDADADVGVAVPSFHSKPSVINPPNQNVPNNESKLMISSRSQALGTGLHSQAISIIP